MRHFLPGRSVDGTAYERARRTRTSRGVLIVFVSVVAVMASSVAAGAQAGSVAAVRSSTPSAEPLSHPPRVRELASFGSGLGSGSAIGPDKALYVTDGNAGSVLRVDPNTGRVTTVASGLPRQVIGIGGAIDVAFIGHTAYVLVTTVSGDL